MTTVLLTGFAPFGGESINPSYEALKLLPNQIAGADIHVRQLPVVFRKDGELLGGLIADLNPDIIICIGQAGGRRGVSFEKIAINCMDASIPDNDGNSPRDEKVEEAGPAAYFSTLPLTEMISSCRKAGFEAKFSYHAGTYVCNDTMYRLLHLLKCSGSHAIGGFIHVPFIPEQVSDGKTSCQPLAETAGCLECAVKTAVECWNGMSAGQERE